MATKKRTNRTKSSDSLEQGKLPCKTFIFFFSKHWALIREADFKGAKFYASVRHFDFMAPTRAWKMFVLCLIFFWWHKTSPFCLLKVIFSLAKRGKWLISTPILFATYMRNSFGKEKNYVKRFEQKSWEERRRLKNALFQPNLYISYQIKSSKKIWENSCWFVLLTTGWSKILNFTGRHDLWFVNDQLLKFTRKILLKNRRNSWRRKRSSIFLEKFELEFHFACHNLPLLFSRQSGSPIKFTLVYVLKHRPKIQRIEVGE